MARFVDSLRGGGLAQVQRVFDFEHARCGDSLYVRFRPQLVAEFLADCGLPGEFFTDRRALDAGCGSGRWTYALAELGAETSAMDLTSSGPEAIQAEMGERANVAVCQASLLRPPFDSESFDFVMSWGVLHHTADTRKAFEKLVPLVKPGGVPYVMVYPHNRPQDFGTDLLRWFMRKLSDERRYAACRLLVIRRRWLAQLLERVAIVSHYDPERSEVDAASMQFGLFDAYSPRYNHRHSGDEVASWFSSAGFERVRVLQEDTAVKVRGIRRCATALPDVAVGGDRAAALRPA